MDADVDAKYRNPAAEYFVDGFEFWQFLEIKEALLRYMQYSGEARSSPAFVAEEIKDYTGVSLGRETIRRLQTDYYKDALSKSKIPILEKNLQAIASFLLSGERRELDLDYILKRSDGYKLPDELSSHFQYDFSEEKTFPKASAAYSSSLELEQGFYSINMHFHMPDDGKFFKIRKNFINRDAQDRSLKKVDKDEKSFGYEGWGIILPENYLLVILKNGVGKNILSITLSGFEYSKLKEFPASFTALVKYLPIRNHDKDSDIQAVGNNLTFIRQN